MRLAIAAQEAAGCWHNLPPVTGMASRKPIEKTVTKPRRTKAPDNASSSPAAVCVELKREKDYRWTWERISRDFKRRKKSAMPTGIKPVLASIKETAFDDPAWQFEIKWDGYRALAYNDGSTTELRSRNNLSLNGKFAPVVTALRQWPVRAVLDGEVVILSKEGKADFAALQNYDERDKPDLRYYVFDLLWVEGIDLRGEPLHVRRGVLKQLLPEDGIIRYSESVDECGQAFFAAAKNAGLEGMMAKRKDSLYETGLRTTDWYKIKLECRHEAVICGYTKQRGSERLFSSLVLGIPAGDGLRYIGQVGTGFTGKGQWQLFKKMNPLFTSDCPFAARPATGAPTQWVKPALVCEVKYTALTTDGFMRHPSFQGLREDKDVSGINLSETCAGGDRKGSEPLHSAHQNKPAGNDDEPSLVRVEGHKLSLTHLQKNYWPKEGFTKGDVIRYYRDMAPFILPYLQDRPQSLHRFPNGIDGQSFYQKDTKGRAPRWAKTFSRISESDGETKNYLVCDGEASLLYMANLGCIEMNPWHARRSSPLRPDWCVIDLDPGDISFSKVIQTANVVKQLLDGLAIPSFPKTSGATGLHIYIPLGAKYSYEQSRHLAELVANLAHHELPRFTSLERNPRKRKDKIYIDYLQNREIQTVCAPYSLRPRPGATVSAPLRWEEVKKGLTPSQFTIRNMGERLKKEGDLFGGVLGKGINLPTVLQSLSNTQTS